MHLAIRRPTVPAGLAVRVRAVPWPRIRAALFGSRKAKVRTAGLFAALLVMLGVAGVAASWAYGEFGFHPDRNARAWASLPVAYASSASCRECHPGQYQVWSTTGHSGVACETCHGPNPHDPNGPVSLRVSTASGQLCIACHARIVGRPASMPQQDISTHYAGATCIVCHDPHSPVGTQPTPVSHPMENLPACTTCHRTGGIRPLPDGHVQATDRTCLACHRPAAD